MTDFISLIKNYQGITELTAPIINSLIDKITVFERAKGADGEVAQEIKIYYKFVGLVADLHIEPTKRQCVIADRVCLNCGVIYSPKTGSAKYCPTCGEEIHRQQANESKRRSRAKAV